ncbi:MAG: CoA transferase [Chloroflexota bacterium]|nr:CoA transferase [Chloroflexota bacterium]
MAKPLEGVTVLDLTRVLAGPYCGMLLGDLGADVIKVERPGRGDDSRAWSPPSAGGESAYYLSANRNKRGITLNLKHPAGRELLKLLTRQADILMENFKFGDMDAMGAGYEQLASVNPGLIYCSFTGFGAGSPYQHRPGYDFAIQAMSGHMSITGEPEGEPMKFGVAIIDLLTGLYACSAVQAALRHRDQSGQGQYVEVSLLDSALAGLINVASSFLVDGREPLRYGNAHATVVPYQAFAAKDRHFVLAIGNDQQFRLLCQLIGQPRLADDERYAANPARVANRQPLLDLLRPIFQEHDAQHWLDLLSNAGIPVSPINSVPEILNDPHVAAREMVVEVPHPTAASVLLMAPPFKLSLTPATVDRHPPTLGEHTFEVLHEKLGLSEKEVDALRQSGAI